MSFFKKEKLMLRTVDNERFRQVSDALCKCYDRNALTAMFHSVEQATGMGRNSCLVTPEGQQRPCTQIEHLYSLDKVLRQKEHYAQVLAYFVASPENFRLYYDNLPPHMKAMWLMLIRRRVVEVGGGYDIVSKKGQLSAKDEEVMEWFKVCANIQGYVQMDNSIYALPGPLFPCLSEALADQAFPCGAPQVGLRELPADSRLRPYSLEESADTLFRVLHLLQERGELAQAPVVLNFVRATEAGRKLNMPLPAPELKSTGKVNRCTLYLLVQMYVVAQSFRSQRDGSADSFYTALRRVMLTLNARRDLVLALFFPHLKTLKKSQNSTVALEDVVKALLYSVTDFLKNGENQWMDLEAMAWKLLWQGDVQRVFGFKTQAIRAGEFGNKLLKEDVRVDTAFDQMLLPLVKGFAMLCAVMGMAEVQLNVPLLAGGGSYWDAVTYVRFNERAHFVLGAAPKETGDQPEASEKKTQGPTQNFVLGEERLLIHVAPGSPYAGLLADFADPLTGSFYVVTVESFMRKCTNTRQIDAKIALFRSVVCRTPPPVWEAFFKELYDRFDPFERLRTSEYAVFRVDEKRRDLQRLLMTDPTLRPMVKKAEGYLFLVKSEELDEFARRLRHLGYLLRL